MHFLGEFQVFYGGQSLTSTISPRLQALLVYLLLHRNAPQSRRYLAFLLWPDSSESQARTNLRNLVFTLRQALPESDCFVLADLQTLQWNPQSPFTADIAQFDAAVSQANDTAALREAVDLYSGPLLPDCYDDWIQPERERLQERFIDVLERLILLLEQEQDFRAAIHYTERLLHLDPLREATYRQLMRLHAKCGDRLGVLRVFQTCENVLKRELAAGVSPATRAAYEEMVRMENPPAPSDEFHFHKRSGNLPIPLTSFIGREQQIADLQQLLSQASASHPLARLITLTGTGGCGKTRLAIETGSRMQNGFKDGVWLAELAPLSAPQLVPQFVAAVFGLREKKECTPLETLAGFLEHKSLLLILDNCEHLLGACAQLAEALLKKCPHVQVLATSRERLNLTGEIVWLVPPLSLPDPEAENLFGAKESFEALKRYEAVRLFIDRATAVLPTFAMNQRNAPEVAIICRRLDGIPLAIELAAARVRSLPVEQIAARIQNRFQLLLDGSRTALPRHQTLWNLIDWSYELLPPAEQALMRRLVVFSGGWTLEAAEAVCADRGDGGTSAASAAEEVCAGSGEEGLSAASSAEAVCADSAGIAGSQVINLLTHLVDQSLISYDPSKMRYQMYESIRAYGLEHLSQCGETHKTYQRHRDYYLHLIELLEPELRGPHQVQALEQLEREHDNLRDALNWSQRHESANREEDTGSPTFRMAANLTWYWMMKGFLIEGDLRLKSALDPMNSPAQKPSVELAKALCSTGIITLFQEDHPAAGPWFERGISMLQALGDEWNLARMRPHLAFLIYEQGARDKANAFWEIDTKVLRERKDHWGLGWLLAWRARAARDTGNLAAAQQFYIESARLFREVGDEWAYAIVYSHLGNIELKRGNYAAARQMYERRLAVGHKLKSITHIRISHAWLAEIAKREGNPEQAAFHCKENLLLGLEYGNNESDTPDMFAILAWAFKEQGQWRQAVILFALAERIIKQFSPAIDEDATYLWIKEELPQARAQLSESDFQAARAEGQAMTINQAIPYLSQSS